jgi:hypothetical protein
MCFRKLPGDLLIKELPFPVINDYDKQIKVTEPPIQMEVGQLQYLADLTK